MSRIVSWRILLSGFIFLIMFSLSTQAEEKGTASKPLVEQVVKFFKIGKVPVCPEETIEILVFMSDSDESKAKGGVPVSI